MSTKLPSALKPPAASAVPEDIPMDAQQQLVYQEASTYLQQPSSSFLAPLFAVVPITEGLPQDVVREYAATSSTASSSNAAAAAAAAPEASAALPSSNNRGSPFRFRGAATGTSPPRWYMVASGVDNTNLATSSLRTTQPLQEALNQLDGIEKKEKALVSQSPLTKELTSVITGEHYVDAVSALVHLEELGKPVPRRVCQHPFRKNDIVWVCRTCQADETCVLCHDCFSQSNHDGHDVSFYHAQAGGCCDCGDPDAWDPKGFCPHHGPDAAAAKASSGPNVLPVSLVHRVRGVVPAVVDWMVHTIAANADASYSRANPRHPPSSEHTNTMDGEEEGENNLMEEEEEDEVNEGGLMDDTMRSSLTVSDLMDLDDDDEISVDELDFPTTNPNLTAPPRTHIFSPTAASAARPHRESADARSHHNAQLAESLGLVGSSGRGLYLVLHADDIHVKHQVVDALRYFWGTGLFFSDMLLNKIAEALRQYGQLIVWGTSEICAEIGPTQAHLWMDGDKLVSTRVGDLMLDRANRLSRHGMFCSILTYNELLLEERAVAVLQWLSAVARSCDPLCQTVAECILPNRHLVPLLRADFKMSSRVTKAWYSLLLTLLAVPAFKSHLAAAYCDTYRQVTAKYARGMGVLERSGYTLSVQFLNRVAYVVDLVQGRDLLGKLGKSLLDTLLVATRTKHYNGRLDPNHFVLAHRRYSPCVSDLKCVLNVAGMPRVTACAGGSFLDDWIAALRVAQFMDPQTWRHWTQGHVEDESRGWVGAFNASISLGSLFERLLGWTDEEESPIKDSRSPLSKDLLTCVELTVHVLLKGIDPWQKAEFAMYQSTPLSSTVVPHRRCSNSLAFSTISAKCGTALAMRQIPISQMTPFSFHLPLHRFVASALRELCLRTNEVESGMTNLMQRLCTLPSSQKRNGDDLFRGLMEFPIFILSRVAQVRSDLWKRSGPGLNDQVLNYAEPPFCRNMRDADLLLTQFSVLGRVQHLSPEPRPSSDVGVAFLVNLLLHRFGIFDFVGFKLAPNSEIDRYREEVGRGMYLSEIVAPGETEAPLPWTYSAGRDPPSFTKLLEEFLHFVIVFITELPHPVPKDRQHQTRQAKYRLFREVVHRLASGPKTHSELSEVHHVLSHWDNVLLNEQGRALNPDDATGAVLGVVLEEVANRRVVRSGRPEPDKWELRDVAWESYDPAFFHISLRSHQTAAESRPKPKPNARNGYGWDPKPFAPRPADAHPFFERLRRDVTADASVVAIAYKVLHLHCRKNTTKDLSDLHGEAIYESAERSETALARSVHLLTLGAYAWCDAQQDDNYWRDKGGGSVGSVFFDRMDGVAAPTVVDWITTCLLQEPCDLLDSDWYEGEENALVLLHRLAMNGGGSTGFMAQDTCLRSGAAWLCKFAASHCPAAAAIIAPSVGVSGSDENVGETEIEKRRRFARERQLRVMASMKAQAAKFASTVDEDDKEDLSTSFPVSSPDRPVRAGSFGSTMSSSSSLAAGESDSGHVPNCASLASDVGNIDLANVPPRLMHTRPRCIICNYEESSEGREFERDDDGEGSRKKSRRKTENALGFVGYSQASTVLKGGGGPPPDLSSQSSPLREFVGVHVALCGHAVHSECCESYLATVSHREDRAIGKRDEFRCPLCQRLSNCLVPFIDVALDWIEPPTCLAATPSDSALTERKSQGDQGDNASCVRDDSTDSRSLDSYLSRTSWWLSRHTNSLVWDGHSAFIDRITDPPVESSEETQTRKPSRRMRSLKKKDLYAAWNAMMRTPRFVRCRLRPRSSVAKSEDSRSLSEISTEEDSSGETLVLRRFMDHIADISYKADGKRLGDNALHDLFGEFRHFVIERFAYSVANTSHGGREISEWPECMFGDNLSDTKKQEMSREKLLSKLLLSIQAFTYSCCCEGFEAKRAFRRSTSSLEEIGRARSDSSVSAVLSRFGMSDIECDNCLIILPEPVSTGDGLQPFDGRLGKLRYLALAIVSAAGAVSADLVQLVVPFPVEVNDSSRDEHPERAPIAYPLLFGHVLTHVTTALCAACGRARAQSDSIDLWQVPISTGVFEGSDMQMFAKRVDGVADDCDGFLKLGVLARTLQVLLGRLRVPDAGMSNFEEFLVTLKNSFEEMGSTLSPLQKQWVESCLKLLEVALSGSKPNQQAVVMHLPGFNEFVEACSMASDAAISFVSDFGTILQILVPGIMARYGRVSERPRVGDSDVCSTYSTFESLRVRFQLEKIAEMLESDLVRQLVGNWYTSACTHATEKTSGIEAENDLRRRLRRTQGFRSFDWPSAGTRDAREAKRDTHGEDKKLVSAEQPHDDSLVLPLEVGQQHSMTSLQPGKDILHRESARALVTFSSKKSVPLLGGFMSEGIDLKCSSPRVAVIPTSYTDLYAELGALLPDCEQTAVCLVCGEVLNASGKGECTRHSYKCGAGAGMFFLLQECSGLIMHKSKAAYIHSPYVDSHGETPQYRGRPLNLDLNRYDHLREIWYGHGVRQQVVAERATSRQVILPDFY